MELDDRIENERLAESFKDLFSKEMRNLALVGASKNLSERTRKIVSSKYLPLPEGSEYLTIDVKKGGLKVYVQFSYDTKKVNRLLKQMTKTQALLFESFLEDTFNRKPSWK